MLTDTQAIINKFELYAGDETELSSSESLDLVNKKYEEILDSFDWQFLRKTASGTLPTTVDYIDIASDFKDFTDDLVFYVGEDYEPYKIIPAKYRRDYKDQSNVVYYDARQQRLIFMLQPNEAKAYEYDYLYIPTALDTTGSDPVFPARFWDAIYHAMLLDNDIIQMSEKARTYQAENTALYRSILNRMQLWDVKLSAMNTYGV